MVTDHSEMGTGGRSGSLFVTSHSLYSKTWESGKDVCYGSSLGLPVSCLRPSQVQSDSGKDRKWVDMGLTSQREILPPPQFSLWGT